MISKTNKKMLMLKILQLFYKTTFQRKQISYLRGTFNELPYIHPPWNNYKIKYKKGKHNSNKNALSCIKIPSAEVNGETKDLPNTPELDDNMSIQNNPLTETRQDLISLIDDIDLNEFSTL